MDIIEKKLMEVGMWATCLYIHNTNGLQFVADVFGPDVHESYASEKAYDWGRAPTRAIGKLDNDHRRKLFAIIHQRWTEAAVRDLAGEPPILQPCRFCGRPYGTACDKEVDHVDHCGG